MAGAPLKSKLVPFKLAITSEKAPVAQKEDYFDRHVHQT